LRRTKQEGDLKDRVVDEKGEAGVWLEIGCAWVYEEVRRRIAEAVVV